MSIEEINELIDYLGKPIGFRKFKQPTPEEMEKLKEKLFREMNDIRKSKNG